MGDPSLDQKRRPWLMALGASQLGLLVVAGLMAGLWVDQHWKTTPLFGFLGLACGFGSGIVFLIRLMRITTKE